MNHANERKHLRTFGLMVGGIFGLIGFWPVVIRNGDIRTWAVTVAAALVLPAVLAPRVLGPVHRLWMLSGHALGWINTRFILTLAFFGLFVPLGRFRHVVLAKDPLRRDFEPNATSYRIPRGPRSGSHMTRQF